MNGIVPQQGTVGMFSRDMEGCGVRIRKGDTCQYTEHSHILMLTGPSHGFIFTVTIEAPIDWIFTPVNSWQDPAWPRPRITEREV